MGILGLRKFIDATACSRYLRNALGGGAVPDEGHGDADVAGVGEDAAGLDGGSELSHRVAFSEESMGGSDAAVPVVDHVLVDMNCIVHSCLGMVLRGERLVTAEGCAAGPGATVQEAVIVAVIARLEELLTGVVRPRRSLSLCFDGPAPLAKLHTQRLRRRKLRFMDIIDNNQLTSLDITVGSAFLVQLENRIAQRFLAYDGCGFLKTSRRAPDGAPRDVPWYCPVFLYGSTCVGEGEAKISRALAYLSTQPLPRAATTHRRTPGGAKTAAVEEERSYNPHDSVVIIGNDIDLVLTALAATQYHNLFVLSPATLQLMQVGEVFSRWTHASVGGQFLHEAHQLASARIDFVFLFLLNGGDHYIGLGDAATSLWARYRAVRAVYPRATLVSRNLLSVSIEFFADLVRVEEYTGDADHEVGLALVRAALWSLHATVTGVCPDYRHVPEEMNPTLNHVRAAVKHAKANGQRSIFIRLDEASKPLTPLASFVALMPTEATWPKSIQQALLNRAMDDHAEGSTAKATPPVQKRENYFTAKSLLESHDPFEIAQAAEEAVRVAEPLLRPGERLRTAFSDPVQVNVPPEPAKPVSRYMWHRIQSGKATLPPPPTATVKVIEPPQPLQYVVVDYPSDCRELVFTDPFATRGPSAARRSKRTRHDAGSEAAAAAAATVTADGVSIVKRLPIRAPCVRGTPREPTVHWRRTPKEVERETRRRLRESNALEHAPAQPHRSRQPAVPAKARAATEDAAPTTPMMGELDRDFKAELEQFLGSGSARLSLKVLGEAEAPLVVAPRETQVVAAATRRRRRPRSYRSSR